MTFPNTVIRRLIAPWRARRDRRRAVQEQSILDAIGAGNRWYAHDICDATNIRLRDIAPLLARLEARGAITAGWDDTTPKSEYRRRWYRITEPTFTDGADLLTPELAARIDGRDGRRTGFDRHVDRALRFFRPATSTTGDDLAREAYAAYSLYRDGVDVYAKAPKELP